MTNRNLLAIGLLALGLLVAGPDPVGDATFTVDETVDKPDKKPGDGRCNVVCVHPAGGTAFCYLSLAKMLPENCGVYGLQSHGLNDGEAFSIVKPSALPSYPVHGMSLPIAAASTPGVDSRFATSCS